MINTIIQGHAKTKLPDLPAESVNCCVCSPPYWGLRDYGIEPVIWDGDKDCEHEWKVEITKRPNASGGKTDWAKEKLAIKGVDNYQEFVDYHKRETTSDFCSRCGAWRGSLGLEPTFELYIKHLCDIFDEVKRVLRKDGTCWVNIGDSYNGSKVGNTNASTGAIGKPKYSGDFTKTFKKENQNNIPTKSLCDIPYRFSIEMINRGWILRNTIIWHKPNCMPASADDRFTVDFEYLFFFTKNNKAIFWTNEKTLECISKKPAGTKGIEDKDWEWRPCPACNGKGRKENKVCQRCKGLGKVKYSFWSGHDYWFEQLFEPILTDSIKRELRGNRPNKYSKDKHLPKGVHPNTMSQVRGYRGYDNLEEEVLNRSGRNKRCVWTIPTQPFPEAHFAVYPEALIEPMIRAGCPEFVCKKCGKARVKIYETERIKCPPIGGVKKSGGNNPTYSGNTEHNKVTGYHYSDCGCNAGFEPSIVLDPFMGAGTTALVALKQRKRFIGIEIKKEYIQMACKRISKVQQKIF